MRCILNGHGWRKKLDLSNPKSVFILQGTRAKIIKYNRSEEKMEGEVEGNPFGLIQDFVSEEEGTKVGFISYNLSRFVEDIKIAEDDLNIPDSILMSFDKESDNDKEDVDWSNSNSNLTAVLEGRTLDETAYKQSVIYAKKRIEEGYIYQVNLATRYDISITVSASRRLVFENYSKNQRVPFSAYLDFDSFSIISGSMELFLRKEGKKIYEHPIKGTGFPGESKLLLGDEKEIAENLMIVDMVRNDLGRICKFGTIKAKLFNIEEYISLIHLVSYVEGEIAEGNSISDILKATFPPASVTGAPKKTAMEIIERLEKKRRGPYCGAICVFYPDGDLEMSVAIRTAVFNDTKGYFWVGSGIVWDSDPDKEYKETELKAKVFMKTIGLKKTD